MAFVIIEGVDATGKSTVTDYYRKQGYKVVHMSAPDKKYTQPGYTGPSFLDEMVELFTKCDGENVVFDRSHYGEHCIWPQIYNRKSLLNTEDMEILKDFENSNGAKRILMVDPNVEAHWKRCVDNNEPLTRKQFDEAAKLYSKMAHEHGFTPMDLETFNAEFTASTRKDNNTVQQEEFVEGGEVPTPGVNSEPLSKSEVKPVLQKASSEIQEKLETANAINAVLTKRIVKQKGHLYDQIDDEIKKFLRQRLSEIMGTSELNPTSLFSDDEVQMLKGLCGQWKLKLKGK